MVGSMNDSQSYTQDEVHSALEGITKVVRARARA